jgi:hypothetical protein
MITVSLALNFLYSVLYEAVLLFLAIIVWQEWVSYRRLSHVKGPFWAQFTSLWISGAVATKRQHLELFEVSQKYGLPASHLTQDRASLSGPGELARIGPNLLLTSDPDQVQRMSSARSGYTKGGWYTGQKLQAGRDNIFSTVDEKAHMKRRTQMAAGVCQSYFIKTAWLMYHVVWWQRN